MQGHQPCGTAIMFVCNLQQTPCQGWHTCILEPKWGLDLPLAQAGVLHPPRLALCSLQGLNSAAESIKVLLTWHSSTLVQPQKPACRPAAAHTQWLAMLPMPIVPLQAFLRKGTVS